jgi:hypothetical protein
MQTRGGDRFQLRAELITKAAYKIIVLSLMAAAFVALQGCGGHAALPLDPNGNQTLQSIQIAPATSLIPLAGNLQLTAEGTYSDGTTLDVTSQVKWSASSAPSTTDFVTVNSSGVASAKALGTSVITATLGSVVGLRQLTVNTNGYTSGTFAILAVPFKTSIIDAAYLPQSQSKIQAAYAVQEVNLDADQFSNVLPVPVALLASIPMPSGFVPNATAASQASNLVAVISYSSPQVQIIDASNIPSDLANNTVINTFTAPVSGTVTFNGISCTICAAVVNPVTNQLLLSTAQGYYSMDFTTGVFTPLSFTPAALPSPNFSLNPIATDPYLLSTNPTAGEIQILDLTHNTATDANPGLTAPGAAALDLFTDYAAVVDADTNNQSLLTLATPQSPLSSATGSVGVCVPSSLMNMVALGITANPVVSNSTHTLFTSQTSGNCVGMQIWPNFAAGQLQTSSGIPYGYGPLPPTPDNKPFLNGTDPNAIATFTSVVNKGNYGLLVDETQQWMAKVNFNTVIALAGDITSAMPFPAGVAIPASDLATGNASDGVFYLPTPSTEVTLSLASINFGNQPAGTASPQTTVTVSNIGPNTITFSQIAIQGPNAGDFSQNNTCIAPLVSQSSCAINVTFTPTASTGTGSASATLNVTDNGGASPQVVALSGTGT